MINLFRFDPDLFRFDLFPLHLQVIGVMRMNVEKVLERDQRLSELDDRSGNLSNVPFN